MSRKNRIGLPAQTLQEWMERTGTNNRRLLSLLRERGCLISEGHLSNILKRSRRVSLEKALYLHDITGVPIKNMVEWPPVRKPRANGANA